MHDSPEMLLYHEESHPPSQPLATSFNHVPAFGYHQDPPSTLLKSEEDLDTDTGLAPMSSLGIVTTKNHALAQIGPFKDFLAST